jgi:hypothetical protein
MVDSISPPVKPNASTLHGIGKAEFGLELAAISPPMGNLLVKLVIAMGV